MKKRKNTIFLSICFLATLLAEAYCIKNLSGNIFTILGIGGVVLITGYLLLESIRTTWLKNSENAKLYFDKLYQEETSKWNERYTEFDNLQKATYTAIKKNTAMLQEQLGNLNSRLDKNEKTLQKLESLLVKSMEGQKNALNIEVNYNKENTKQLIKALKEESEKRNINEQLALILAALEKSKIDVVKQEDTKAEEESEILADASETADIIKEEQESQYTEVSENSDAPVVVPLYDDPNKSLTADEIASLFASFGK
jgi:hypothetical protein